MLTSYAVPWLLGLLELRRLLGLLRDDEPDRLRQEASIEHLDSLIGPAGDAGVQVALRTTGEPVALRRDVELTAYRVVQEALTNVIAHAGPCRVQVVLGYRLDALDVQVIDDGASRETSSRGGYGLVGIRERVLALGGRMEAGPRPEGGFGVRARIPLVAG